MLVLRAMRRRIGRSARDTGINLKRFIFYINEEIDVGTPTEFLFNDFTDSVMQNRSEAA